MMGCFKPSAKLNRCQAVMISITVWYFIIHIFLQVFIVIAFLDYPAKSNAERNNACNYHYPSFISRKVFVEHEPDAKKKEDSAYRDAYDKEKHYQEPRNYG